MENEWVQLGRWKESEQRKQESTLGADVIERGERKVNRWEINF